MEVDLGVAPAGGFFGELLVEVAGGDDEDGGVRHEARSVNAAEGFQWRATGGGVGDDGVATLEEGVGEGGDGLAAAGVPRLDVAVVEGGAGKIGFLEGEEFHGVVEWWRDGWGS